MAVTEPKMQDQPVTRQISHASEQAGMDEDHKNNEAFASDTSLTANARDATEHEHAITVRHAAKHYKKAIFWSFVVSLSIVMESYDTFLINAFFGYPAFQKKFGQPYGDKGGYQLTPAWQAALTNGGQVGLFIGCLMNGWLADRFGRKLVMQVSYVFLTGALFMMFFANNVQVLFGSQLIINIPMGIFAIMGPTYACEVCPVVLRSYMTGWVNVCWVIGHIIASGVLDGLVTNKTEWAYKIPMAVQWVWPLPLFILMCFAPESPWWLVRKGRHTEAKAALVRLCSKEEAAHVDQNLAMMIHTDAFEQQTETTSGGWADCFRGANLRRTEISVLGWTLQTVAGYIIQGQATYFFEQAGIPTHDAYKLTLGIYFVTLVGNLSCGLLLRYYGRRPVYISGYVIMSLFMFAIAFLGLAPPSNHSVAWGQAILLTIWFFVYGITIGPTAISIASETPAVRLRAKTIAIARNTYYVSAIINNVVTPYLLNPTAANLKGKAAFIPAALNIIAATWAFFRLPECKGRTYEELDILFERGVPARKFKDYQIEIEEVTEEVNTKGMVE